MKQRLLLYRIMCTMFILLSMASCHWLCPDEESPRFDRTVLVYMAAENNLAGKDESGKGFHEQDIDEMLQAAGDIPTNSRVLARCAQFRRYRALEYGDGVGE